MAWSHPSLKEPPPLSPGDTKSIPRSALISSWGAPAMANRYRQVAVLENQTVPGHWPFLTVPPSPQVNFRNCTPCR